MSKQTSHQKSKQGQSANKQSNNQNLKQASSANKQTASGSAKASTSATKPQTRQAMKQERREEERQRQFYTLLSQAPAILSLPVHLFQICRRSGARLGVRPIVTH